MQWQAQKRGRDFLIVKGGLVGFYLCAIKFDLRKKIKFWEGLAFLYRPSLTTWLILPNAMVEPIDELLSRSTTLPELSKTLNFAQVLGDNDSSRMDPDAFTQDRTMTTKE